MDHSKTTNRRRLVVVGAGPKAVAIAVKAHVIHDLCGVLGNDSPEVIVIERESLASHWVGRFGYTDGNQILCTPPEKDIGFPYQSLPPINVEMSKYSWQSFLIETGGFSEWIDRGRPHPRHGRFAEYLEWVTKKIHIQVEIGEVVRISKLGNQWSISVRAKSSRYKIQADGVVVTGHGEPRHFPGRRNDGHIFDGQSFWHRVKDFHGVGEATIAVIGSGETAAAIVVALLAQVSPLTSIVVVNRQGTIFSRGESYDENKLFSHPQKWSHIHIAQRREFIERTDRGVFSAHAKRILNTAENVTHFSLAVDRITANRTGKLLLVGKSDRPTSLECDYVVNATSFDRLWFRKLFSGDTRHLLDQPTLTSLESKVEDDLALRGITPRLHLPMLAALRQGPGFPNLTCLGLLSDRILQPYLTPMSQDALNNRQGIKRARHNPERNQPNRALHSQVPRETVFPETRIGDLSKEIISLSPV